MIKALIALRHPWAFKMGNFFTKQPYLGNILYEIIQELIKLPRTDELEELLIQRMIELEDDYPDIKKLVLKYL